MDDIREIVDRIVHGCAQAGMEVPGVLAAFVARTIVETNASTFALDRKITLEKQEEIILLSIEKLLEKDNPSLEMIKMQVDYDSTYLREENDAQKKLKNRSKMIATHKLAIVEVEMLDANDYEALTTLYRKIFRFLLEFAPNSKSTDRTMEREVAAALESVFPRVGLKAFIQLSYEEKTAQLLELARIILGIRLFNREEGRGGAGIDDMDKDGNILANVLSQDIDQEVEFFADACAKYQKSIIKAHIEKRRKIFEQEQFEAEEAAKKEEEEMNEAEGFISEKSEVSPVPEKKANLFQASEISDQMIERWSHELANRRQYLGFLRTLQDETRFLQEKISSICEKIRQELTNIKSLISDKTSVPKEVVYPRFDALGTVWLQLYEEVVVMIARSNTFQALCKYRLSFNPTLLEKYYLDNNQEELSLIDDREVKNVAPAAQPTTDTDKKVEEEIGSVQNIDTAQTNEEAPETGLIFDESSHDGDGTNGARLLSVQNTPDFMLLPLELQGFCPWTIVEARGLLVPGKPALGIIRYDNLYYVCDHALAIKSFMADPEYYLSQVRQRATQNPEYINLLKLQRWFPMASIAKLLRMHDGEGGGFNQLGQPLTRDAGTSTPTHFVEGYIDINYHWNEWELRRRALKIVNLRSCVTNGMQTDESHFRRDNETQVYEHRIHGTQTKREKGTNPPIVTTYVAGLRGKQFLAEERKQRGDSEYSLDVSEGTEGSPAQIFESQQSERVMQAPKILVHPKLELVTLSLDL